MQEIFQQTEEQNLRTNNPWVLPKARTVNNGIETIRYRGPKTWEIVPIPIRNSKSLTEFQAKIKHWKPQGCTCRLCKVYISNLGFL